MKTVKYLAIIIAFLMSFSVQAVCPTQQMTIFFANGVNVDRDGIGGADDSKQRLKEELEKDSRYKPECISFALAYNTNEPLFLDFVQAIIQKTAEKTGVDNFPWDKWLHPESTADWFESVVQDALFTPARLLVASGRWIFGDQRDEHILAYKAELALGRKVLLASHSQGSINAKEERLIMSPTEKANINIVAAAAFSLPEPDGTRYTTIDRDNLTVGGGGIFTTPEANIFLDGSEFSQCFQDITPSFPFLDCHGFLQSYMRIERSRDKYVNDIIAALPTAPSGGAISVLVLARETHFPLANTAIQLFAIENLSTPIDEKITDTEGNAFFAHVIPGPQNGFRFCRSGTNRCSGFFGVFEGQTLGLTVFF